MYASSSRYHPPYHIILGSIGGDKLECSSHSSAEGRPCCPGTMGSTPLMPCPASGQSERDIHEVGEEEDVTRLPEPFEREAREVAPVVLLVISEAGDVRLATRRHQQDGSHHAIERKRSGYHSRARCTKYGFFTYSAQKIRRIPPTSSMCSLCTLTSFF
jgi:hypothetical protein